MNVINQRLRKQIKILIRYYDIGTWIEYRVHTVTHRDLSPLESTTSTCSGVFLSTNIAQIISNSYLRGAACNFMLIFY